MKIKFLKDSEVEIVVDFDEETEEATTENETFLRGEVHDVDLLNERDDSIDIQFGCGDCCYGLRKNCIEIIERD